MDSSRVAFLKAIKSFPRWMDIRKRPSKSTGGKLLESIMAEQDNFKVALDKFKSDFFLVSYVGREDEILDTVYVYQIGDVDPDVIELIEPEIALTTEPRTFIEDFDSYAFYQSGYIMLSPKVKGSLKHIRLTVNGYKYGGKLQKMPIWNIFDEFAMFLSLERYDDESNKELMQRCFAAFKNPTNSTEAGIKNAIINSVVNILPVSEDDIVIESPSQDNVYEKESSGEEIYEKLAAFNQDIFRTKHWDMDTWEHSFKQLDFIPHTWDAPIEVYQDGVGQMDDLKVSFANDVESLEKTDVEVTGYKADTVTVNSYVLSQNIKKEIPLTLTQYKNELKPKKVQYKITATPAVKIESPSKIYLKSLAKSTGETTQYLEDIVTSATGATITNGGALTKGHIYKLVFKARNAYSDMNIDRINLVSDGKERSLITETTNFKKVEGTLKNVDVTLHVDEVNGLKSSENIINHKNGLQLDTAQTIGDMYIDVTGMGGNYISIGHDCDSEDITMNRALVKLNGFTETADNKLVDNTSSIGSTISIDAEGYELSFDYINATNQGSCTVLVTVDGQVDTVNNSGLWTSSRSFSGKYDHCAKINVLITKAGMHPVQVANIRAKRYKVEMELQNAQNRTELINTAYGSILPQLEENTKNTLHVRLTNLGAKTPVIQYIHVGASMEYASYEVSNIVAGANAALDIRTNCRVELYDTTSEVTLVSSDYSTLNRYKNATADDIYIAIDTSAFVSVQSSSKKIENATKNGKTVKCIRLKPNEELDTISITGTIYTLKSRDKLSALLELDTNDEVYASKNAAGFIVKDIVTKAERKLTIKRSAFSSSSETLSIEGLPSGLVGVFVIDEENNKLATGDSFDHNFEHMYIMANGDEEYVAYNDTTLFQSPVQNVPVVNTFSPILDTTKLMYYEIADVVIGEDTSTKVKFMKTDSSSEKWALGLNSLGLQIETDMGCENSSNYDTSISRLNEAFTIANNIELPNTITSGSEELELARYIITPPDTMEINYVEEVAGEKDIIVENDGFNKLYYANVTKIEDVRQNGVSVGASKYKLLLDGKEGIILWTDESLYGQTVDIIYSYNKPKTLTYKSLSSLYDLVGYSTDAYKKLDAGTITMLDLTDGDSRTLDFGKEKADKVIIHCTNSNFQAIVDGNTIKVKRISQDNNALINTGYYYDDGVEYYLFNNLHNEKIDRMSGVEMFNVKRYGNTLVMIRRSANYLKDSAFNSGRKENLCYIDCATNSRIEGLSRLESITACDSYNMWQGFNMDVSLKQGVHDLGIYFEAQDNNAYAVMDISRIAKPNMLLSFAATNTLSTAILKERLAGAQSMKKSVFAETYADITDDGKYRSYIFPEDVDTSVRYYLLVQSSGLIDDIIARPYDASTSSKELHQKTIEAVGFSIDEQIEKNTKLYMGFDVVGNKLNGLDITKSGMAITGSNVDWGLTKVYDVADDMESCKLVNAVYKLGAFYAEEKNGSVKTPTIYLENYKAINSIFVKVNDVLIPSMSGFTIKTYAAPNKQSTFQLIAEETKSNIAQVFKTKLKPYLQIEVDMPTERVINTIEIYAEYAETDDSPLHIVPNDSGTLITKVYDTAYAADYQLAQIEGTLSNTDDIDIYVRGCRRDTGHEVWTKWYKEPLTESLDTEMPHIFENYQLFQFKLELKSSKAQCSIKNFVLEVV